MKNPVLIRTVSLAYMRAIRNEENAETLEEAWRLAEISERHFRDLQAAQAGLPLPSRTERKVCRQRALKAWETIRARKAVAS